MSEEQTQQTTDQAANPEEQTEQPEVKTFTQDEVNAIASKESKKAQEAFLKKLGFEDFKNAKDGLNKYKEWADSQKSEAEKQAEELQKIQTDYSSVSEENTTLKAQITAMQAGVNGDSVSDVVTLAQTLVSDDTDINQAIAQVVEKYPHFKQQETDDKKPTFTTGQHQKQAPSVADQWLDAFNKMK